MSSITICFSGVTKAKVHGEHLVPKLSKIFDRFLIIGFQILKISNKYYKFLI